MKDLEQVIFGKICYINGVVASRKDEQLLLERVKQNNIIIKSITTKDLFCWIETV